jgi:hypothetical protein
VTQVPEKVHVELGASSSHRWIECPGSVQLSRGLPNYETEHARNGTAAHAVGELCLRNGTEPATYVGLTIEGVEITEEMAEAVSVYTDYCRSLMQEPGAKWWIEQRVTLAKLNPPAPMLGTSDFPIYKPALKELEVVDYKNGSGVLVDARNNPQLKYYAIGSILALGPGYDIETVKVTIVQPNAAHPEGVVRSETMDYHELLAFSGELLNAARATLQPDAPLHPGSHCRFCPASAICPAQREQAQALAQVAFSDMPLDVPPAPEVLPPEVFADILGKLHILEDWAAAMRAHALRELEAGRPVPGFKLVAKNANRRWTSEKAVEEYLTEQGYSSEEISESKLKSPAKIEALLNGGKATKRKDRVQLPAELVEKPDIGHTLAPDHDARPALQLHPGDGFAALPSGE